MKKRIRLSQYAPLTVTPHRDGVRLKVAGIEADLNETTAYDVANAIADVLENKEQK